MHESTRSSGSHGCCVYPESFDASDDWLSSCDQCSTSERLGIRGTGSRVGISAGGSFDDASSGARRSSAVLPVCIARHSAEPRKFARCGPSSAASDVYKRQS